jgi:hypothetical protein
MPDSSQTFEEIAGEIKDIEKKEQRIEYTLYLEKIFHQFRSLMELIKEMPDLQRNLKSSGSRLTKNGYKITADGFSNPSKGIHIKIFNSVKQLEIIRNGTIVISLSQNKFEDLALLKAITRDICQQGSLYMEKMQKKLIEQRRKLQKMLEEF